MKTRKYILFALAALLTASCMDDDWKASKDPTKGQDSYGNQNIFPTNVMTVQELKNSYSEAINSTGKTPISSITSQKQIEVIVTGNDVGGNLYQQIAVADETGSIIINIAQSGIYGYLPIGQKILIELEGLYIGSSYRQPQIGMPYTSNSGYTQPGRMTRYIWQQHFKITGDGTLATVTPREITDVNQLNLATDGGMLITMKGVEIEEADGTATWAPSDGSVKVSGNGIDRHIKGISDSQMVIHSSQYADFANQAMPTGKVDITAIASRYLNKWQLYIRDANDVVPAQ